MMRNRTANPRPSWLPLLLWALVLLNVVGALLLPPWLDDDTRRRIAASGRIHVGLDPAYPPFELDVQGELVGYDVDLARALGRQLDLEVVFVPMGYDSLYEAMLAGQIDLILSSYPYSLELCRRERCTETYFEAGQMLVVRADSEITGPEDLADHAVGVEWGGAGDALLRPWEQAGRIGARVPFMSAQDALQALAVGEVDAAVVDRISALAFADEVGNLVVLEPPLQSEAFVGVVAGRSVWLHRRLQGALRQLSQDGSLDTLEARWFQSH